MRLELRCGADVNARNTYYDPPAGCVDNCGDPDYYSVLHSAAAYNADPAVIRALLAAGANPGATDGDGVTPLDLARHGGDAATIRILEEAAGS